MSDSSSLQLSIVKLLRREWMLVASYATTAAFFVKGHDWLDHNPGLLYGTIIFVWLFAIMLQASFAVVRHADHLAEELREPFGTLILTLSVTSDFEYDD